MSHWSLFLCLVLFQLASRVHAIAQDQICCADAERCALSRADDEENDDPECSNPLTQQCVYRYPDGIGFPETRVFLNQSCICIEPQYRYVDENGHVRCVDRQYTRPCTRAEWTSFGVCTSTLDQCRVTCNRSEVTSSVFQCRILPETCLDGLVDVKCVIGTRAPQCGPFVDYCAKTVRRVVIPSEFDPSTVNSIISPLAFVDTIAFSDPDADLKCGCSYGEETGTRQTIQSFHPEHDGRYGGCVPPALQPTRHSAPFGLCTDGTAERMTSSTAYHALANSSNQCDSLQVVGLTTPLRTIEAVQSELQSRTTVDSLQLLYVTADLVGFVQPKFAPTSTAASFFPALTVRKCTPNEGVQYCHSSPSEADSCYMSCFTTVDFSSISTAKADVLRARASTLLVARGMSEATANQAVAERSDLVALIDVASPDRSVLHIPPQQVNWMAEMWERATDGFPYCVRYHHCTFRRPCTGAEVSSMCSPNARACEVMDTAIGAFLVPGTCICMPDFIGPRCNLYNRDCNVAETALCRVRESDSIVRSFPCTATAIGAVACSCDAVPLPNNTFAFRPSTYPTLLGKPFVDASIAREQATLCLDLLFVLPFNRMPTLQFAAATFGRYTESCSANCASVGRYTQAYLASQATGDELQTVCQLQSPTCFPIANPAGNDLLDPGRPCGAALRLDTTRQHAPYAVGRNNYAYTLEQVCGTYVDHQSYPPAPAAPRRLDILTIAHPIIHTSVIAVAINCVCRAPTDDNAFTAYFKNGVLTTPLTNRMAEIFASNPSLAPDFNNSTFSADLFNILHPLNTEVGINQTTLQSFLRTIQPLRAELPCANPFLTRPCDNEEYLDFCAPAAYCSIRYHYSAGEIITDGYVPHPCQTETRFKDAIITLESEKQRLCGPFVISAVGSTCTQRTNRMGFTGCDKAAQCVCRPGFGQGTVGLACQYQVSVCTDEEAKYHCGNIQGVGCDLYKQGTSGALADVQCTCPAGYRLTNGRCAFLQSVNSMASAFPCGAFTASTSSNQQQQVNCDCEAGAANFNATRPDFGSKVRCNAFTRACSFDEVRAHCNIASKEDASCNMTCLPNQDCVFQTGSCASPDSSTPKRIPCSQSELASLGDLDAIAWCYKNCSNGVCEAALQHECSKGDSFESNGKCYLFDYYERCTSDERVTHCTASALDCRKRRVLLPPDYDAQSTFKCQGFPPQCFTVYRPGSSLEQQFESGADAAIDFFNGWMAPLKTYLQTTGIGVSPVTGLSTHWMYECTARLWVPDDTNHIVNPLGILGNEPAKRTAHNLPQTCSKRGHPMTDTDYVYFECGMQSARRRVGNAFADKAWNAPVDVPYSWYGLVDPSRFATLNYSSPDGDGCKSPDLWIQDDRIPCEWFLLQGIRAVSSVEHVPDELVCSNAAVIDTFISDDTDPSIAFKTYCLATTDQIGNCLQSPVTVKQHEDGGCDKPFPYSFRGQAKLETSTKRHICLPEHPLITLPWPERDWGDDYFLGDGPDCYNFINDNNLYWDTAYSKKEPWYGLPLTYPEWCNDPDQDLLYESLRRMTPWPRDISRVFDATTGMCAAAGRSFPVSSPWDTCVISQFNQNLQCDATTTESTSFGPLRDRTSYSTDLSGVTYQSVTSPSDAIAGCFKAFFVDKTNRQGTCQLVADFGETASISSPINRNGNSEPFTFNTLWQPSDIAFNDYIGTNCASKLRERVVYPVTVSATRKVCSAYDVTEYVNGVFTYGGGSYADYGVDAIRMFRKYAAAYLNAARLDKTVDASVAIKQIQAMYRYRVTRPYTYGSINGIVTQQATAFHLYWGKTSSSGLSGSDIYKSYYDVFMEDDACGGMDCSIDPALSTPYTQPYNIGNLKAYAQGAWGMASNSPSAIDNFIAASSSFENIVFVRSDRSCNYTVQQQTCFYNNPGLVQSGAHVLCNYSSPFLSYYLMNPVNGTCELIPVPPDYNYEPDLCNGRGWAASIGSGECNCLGSGYIGTNCEIPFCQNGVWSYAEQRCRCNFGYQGARCHNNVCAIGAGPAIDANTPAACHGRGYCVGSRDGFEWGCECSPQYSNVSGCALPSVDYLSSIPAISGQLHTTIGAGALFASNLDTFSFSLPPSRVTTPVAYTVSGDPSRPLTESILANRRDGMNAYFAIVYQQIYGESLVLSTDSQQMRVTTQRLAYLLGVRMFGSAPTFTNAAQFVDDTRSEAEWLVLLGVSAHVAAIPGSRICVPLTHGYYGYDCSVFHSIRRVFSDSETCACGLAGPRPNVAIRVESTGRITCADALSPTCDEYFRVGSNTSTGGYFVGFDLCKNGGTPVYNESTLQMDCACASFFTGVRCELYRCPQNCNGRSRCLPVSGDPSDNRYTCLRTINSQRVCDAPNNGYTGEACEIKLADFCVPPSERGTPAEATLCSGNGACVSTSNAAFSEPVYACACTTGGFRTGTYCQEPVCPDDCSGQPTQFCQRNATSGNYACQCGINANTNRLMTGTACQIDVTQQCTQLSITGNVEVCGGSGQCLSSIGADGQASDYGCVCDNFFSGPLCQAAQCPIQCINGDCQENTQSWSCSCWYGWESLPSDSAFCNTSKCAPGLVNQYTHSRATCGCPDSRFDPAATPACSSLLCPFDSITQYVCGLQSSSVCNNGTCSCPSTHYLEQPSDICRPYCDPVHSIDAQIPCVCQQGFNPASNCSGSVCQNGGTAMLSTAMPPPCICPSGVIEAYFDNRLALAGCQNTCNFAQQQACQCVNGFAGSNCEINICGGGRQGVYNASTASCECEFPFSGENCQNAICYNGASVVQSASGTYSCMCIEPFVGLSCNISKCGQYGQGTPQGGCSCTSQYWGGKYCHVSLCANNGLYNQTSDACDCTAAFHGAFCELEVCADDNAAFNEETGLCDCIGLYQFNETTQRCEDHICGFNSSISKAYPDICACTGRTRMYFDVTEPPLCRRSCLNSGVYDPRNDTCNCTGLFSGDWCEQHVVLDPVMPSPVQILNVTNATFSEPYTFPRTVDQIPAFSLSFLFSDPYVYGPVLAVLVFSGVAITTISIVVSIKAVSSETAHTQQQQSAFAGASARATQAPIPNV